MSISATFRAAELRKGLIEQVRNQFFALSDHPDVIKLAEQWVDGVLEIRTQLALAKSAQLPDTSTVPIQAGTLKLLQQHIEGAFGLWNVVAVETTEGVGP